MKPKSSHSRTPRTPSPWRQSSKADGDEYTCVILAGKGTRQMVICRTQIRCDGSLDYTEAEENAAFIVQACNAFDSLARIALNRKLALVGKWSTGVNLTKGEQKEMDYIEKALVEAKIIPKK